MFMQEEDVLKEVIEIDKEIREGKDIPKAKSPLWYFIGVLLALALVLMVIPYYSIRLDPNPSVIPSLEEVFSGDILVNETHFGFISLEMVEGYDPVIKEVADKIVVKACKDKNRVCDAKAIFYFVRDNFEYVSDPTAYEYVKTAKESLVSGGGDCEDSHILVANLMEAVGIQSRFVFIPGHVYLDLKLPEALNRYKQDGDWVSIDATCRNCEFGEIPYQNYNQDKIYLP